MQIGDIITYLSWLVAMPFIFRFHLEQTAINPYHRSIRLLLKITDPFVVICRTLTRVKFINTIIPLIIGYLLVLAINSSAFVLFDNMTIKALFANSIFHFIQAWIKLIIYSLVIYVICSWVRIPQLATISYILHYFLQPILLPIQRVIPAVAGLDLSPMIVLFGLFYLERILPVIIMTLFSFT